MKLLAIIDLASGAAIDQLGAGLLDELKGSWALYASGVLREVYATASPTRVVFVLEAEQAAHAESLLRGLPLVAAGAFCFELVELRPFANWSRLFAP